MLNVCPFVTQCQFSIHHIKNYLQSHHRILGLAAYFLSPIIFCIAIQSSVQYSLKLYVLAVSAAVKIAVPCDRCHDKLK